MEDDEVRQQSLAVAVMVQPELTILLSWSAKLCSCSHSWRSVVCDLIDDVISLFTGFIELRELSQGPRKAPGSSSAVRAKLGRMHIEIGKFLDTDNKSTVSTENRLPLQGIGTRASTNVTRKNRL